MRVALYWAPPPQTDLWRQGSAWLGRDAYTRETLAQPAISGLSAERFAALTADARRYGWHATIRAPFVLKDGVSLAQVEATVDAWMKRFTPFALSLQPSVLAGFCALRPVHDAMPLHELANSMVVALDTLAAAPDLAKQAARAAQLSARERELDQRWGYPYVFEHHRFHCTLAAAAEPAEQAALLAAAREYFGEEVHLRVDGLALFIEPQPGSPFLYHRTFPMEPSHGQ